MLMHENMEENAVNEYSPVTLAYIGDAVYELMARQYILQGTKRKIRDIHNETVKIVQATGQAEFLHHIKPILTEKELDIVRRGRNTKSLPPKNASVADYKLSTGLEALLGYLYLSGKEERLKELFFSFYTQG